MCEKSEDPFSYHLPSQFCKVHVYFPVIEIHSGNTDVVISDDVRHAYQHLLSFASLQSGWSFSLKLGSTQTTLLSFQVRARVPHVLSTATLLHLLSIFFQAFFLRERITLNSVAADSHYGFVIERCERIDKRQMSDEIIEVNFISSWA